ncbi:hypothetical protein [Kyrpidia spormannii]|uniref:Uncharacterized protein n=1 Tax=Kyrpidia spormannii TaxID=2055160 RepID=A0A6F9EFI7_9BACL|nr:hypothetical protein [Kyrpidia spormannii]CAB3395254.1 protein of unknown function [Kyrpidia spormannii]
MDSERVTICPSFHLAPAQLKRNWTEAYRRWLHMLTYANAAPDVVFRVCLHTLDEIEQRLSNPFVRRVRQFSGTHREAGPTTTACFSPPVYQEGTPVRADVVSLVTGGERAFGTLIVELDIAEVLRKAQARCAVEESRAHLEAVVAQIREVAGMTDALVQSMESLRESLRME